jgi:hypothetical protein
MIRILALALCATQASADSIMSFIMGPPTPETCLTQLQIEATAHGDREAWPLYQLLNGERCGFAVDLASNYIPGHPLYFWDQPEPLPAPVPLTGSLGFLSIAILALVAAKRRMI